jgi:hypothetical protein
MSPNATAGSSESQPGPNEEHWSLVSVAFGAVSGTIIAILIQPLVELLPARLFEEFVSHVVEALLMLGLPILFAFIASRIRRLDHFLRRYLPRAALVASVILAASLWAHAGRPMSVWAVVAVVLTVIETWLFLLFCGGAVGTGLLQIVGRQKAEYEKIREEDAQRIVEEAIAEGEPDMATAIFSLNIAGAVGAALAHGCLGIVLVTLHMVAIWVVRALDAYVLFRLSLVWSVIAGTFVAAATIRLVTVSEEFGEQHSETVPLKEKYKGILPNREDPD